MLWKILEKLSAQSSEQLSENELCVLNGKLADIIVHLNDDKNKYTKISIACYLLFCDYSKGSLLEWEKLSAEQKKELEDFHRVCIDLCTRREAFPSDILNMPDELNVKLQHYPIISSICYRYIQLINRYVAHNFKVNSQWKKYENILNLNNFFKIHFPPAYISKDDLNQYKVVEANPLGGVNNFLQCFTDAVNKRKQAIAIIDHSGVLKKGREITYAELDRITTVLAKQIRDELKHKQNSSGQVARSIKAPERIGVYVPHSALSVISLLAIWKAGYSYVPLSQHESMTNKRLWEIKAKCDLCMVLTLKVCRDAYFVGCVESENKCRILEVNIQELDAFEIKNFIPAELDKNSLAYIMPSSGTTGNPKNIAIKHGGLYAPMLAHHEILKITAGKRIALNADIAFDPFIMEVMTALGTNKGANYSNNNPIYEGGGCLYIFPESSRRDSDELQKFYSENGIQVAIFTPTQLEQLDPNKFPDLECIISMGEELSKEIVEKWRDAKQKALAGKRKLTFINGYGPTEATICTCMTEIITIGEEGEITFKEHRPIGPVIQGLNGIVLSESIDTKFAEAPKTSQNSTSMNADNVDDKLFLEVNNDEPGELFIQGFGIGEYWGEGEEERNKKRFFPKLYVEGTDGKIRCYENVYRTGDLVTRNKQGELVFIKRIDYELKLNGIRIDVEFYTKQMKSHVDVQRVEIGTLSRSLIAVIWTLSKPPSDTLARELRTLIGKQSVPYKILINPDINSKHRTVSGKLIINKVIQDNRNKIDKDLASTPVTRKISDDECAIENVWKEILNIDIISPPEASFRDMGGSSLILPPLLRAMKQNQTLTQMFNNINELTIQDLLHYDNIPAMARRLRTLKVDGVLKCLQKGNSNNIPLFLIPSVTGDGELDYTSIDFVKGWGRKKTPIYTFKALGLTDPNVQVETVQEIAWQYNYCILSVLNKLAEQHHEEKNECVLFAYSSGCSIAFEMAIELQKKHAINVKVCLIDGVSPVLLQSMSCNEHKGYLTTLDMGRKVGRLAGIEEDTLKNFSPYLDDCLNNISQVEKIFKSLEDLSHSSNSNDADDDNDNEHNESVSNKLRVMRHIALSNYSYDPRNYLHDVDLITCKHTQKLVKDKSLGWPLFKCRAPTKVDCNNHFDILQKCIGHLRAVYNQACDKFSLNDLIKKSVRDYENINLKTVLANGTIRTRPIYKAFLDFSFSELPLTHRTARASKIKKMYDVIPDTGKLKLVNDETPKQANAEIQKHENILISGPVGCGLTTMCKTIAHQWAMGKLGPKKHYDLVLLIQLDQTLSNLKDRLNAIKAPNLPNANILLIFDGYNQFLNDPELEQFISDIIASEKFSIILTTNFPTEVLKKMINFDKSFEIQGYNEANFELFIRNYFETMDIEAHQKRDNDIVDTELSDFVIIDKKSRVSELIDAVKTREELKNISHSPLLLTALCDYWSEHHLLNDSAINITGIMEYLTKVLWTRYAKKAGNQITNISTHGGNFTTQEQAQNLLEHLAADTYPNHAFKIDMLENRIKLWYKSKTQTDNIGSERLANIIQLLLETGLISKNTQLNEFQFVNPYMVRYLTIQFLSKNLTLHNREEYSRYEELIASEPSLYNRFLEIDPDNKFLNMLYNTKIIKDLSREQRCEILKYAKEEIGNSKIDESPLFRILKKLLGERLKDLDIELQSIDEDYTLKKTVLKQIYKFVPDSSIIKHLNRGDAFFTTQRLVISSKNVNVNADIDACKHDENTIVLGLDDPQKVAVKLTHSRGEITGAFLTRRMQYDLVTYLNLLFTDEYSSTTIEVQARDNDLEDNILAKGLYKIKSIKNATQGNMNTSYFGQVVDLGAGLVSSGVGLVSSVIGSKKTKKSKAHSVASDTSNESVRSYLLENVDNPECRYRITVHNDRYNRQPTKVMVALEPLPGKNSKMHNESYILPNHYFVYEKREDKIADINADNCKNTIKVKDKYTDVNKRRRQKITECNAIRDEIINVLKSDANKAYLQQCLVNLIQTNFRKITDNKLIDANIDHIGKLKNKLTQLSTLYSDLGVESDISKILANIIVDVNYYRITNMGKDTVALKTLQFLKEANAQMGESEGKDCILFWGPTGAGKSTAINYFIGHELKVTENELGQFIVTLEEGDKLDPKTVALIGHNQAISETAYSRGFSLVKRKDIKNANDISLVDNAGTSENRGFKWELAGNISSDQIIQQARSIKSVVLTIPYDAFTVARANLVIQLFDDLRARIPNLFNPDSNIKQSVFLLITKNQRHRNVKDLGATINNFVKQEKQRRVSLDPINDKDEISHIERRLLIWETLESLHESGNIKILDPELNDPEDRKKYLNDFINKAPGINKEEFTKTMDRPTGKLEFVKCIESSIGTWKTKIIEPYLYSLPTHITSTKNEIMQLCQRKANLEQDNLLRQQSIVDWQSKINALELRQNEYADILAHNRWADNDLKNKLRREFNDASADINSQLRDDLIRLNASIASETEWLDRKQNEIDALEKNTPTQKDLDKIDEDIEKLRDGDKKISLWKFKSSLGQKIVSCKYKDGSYDTALNNCRALNEGDRIPGTDTTQTAGQFENDLVYQEFIHQDFYIVPREPDDRKTFLQDLQGNTPVGKFQAFFDGHRAKLLAKNADATAKNMVCRVSTKWIKTSDPNDLPSFEVSHNLPNHLRNEGPITDLDALKKSKTQEIKDNAAKLKLYRSQLSALQEKLKQYTFQKEEIERNIVVNENAVFAEKIGDHIIKYKKLIDECSKKAQAEGSAINGNRVSIAEIEGLIYNLKDKLTSALQSKIHYASVVKTNFDDAKLLREFAKLALAGDLDLGEYATDSLPGKCQSYIAYYDANQKALQEACERDVSSAVDVDAQVDEFVSGALLHYKTTMVLQQNSTTQANIGSENTSTTTGQFESTNNASSFTTADESDDNIDDSDTDTDDKKTHPSNSNDDDNDNKSKYRVSTNNRKIFPGSVPTPFQAALSQSSLTGSQLPAVHGLFNSTAKSKVATDTATSSTTASTSYHELTHRKYWYQNDDMNTLLHHYIDEESYNVQILTAIDAYWRAGEVAAESLYDNVLQSVLNLSNGVEMHNTQVMPVNLGNAHWAALYIHYPSADRMKPEITYVDPMGQTIPSTLSEALKTVFPGINVKDIFSSPICLQNDGYNCGPWVINILARLITTDGKSFLPPDGFDINNLRVEHMSILQEASQVTPVKRTTLPSATSSGATNSGTLQNVSTAAQSLPQSDQATQTPDNHSVATDLMQARI